MGTPLALLSSHRRKDYGWRGIRADPLNMVPKLVASLLGVYRCPAQTFMGIFLYDRVFQTSGERWEHSTNIIGIISNLYRKKLCLFLIAAQNKFKLHEYQNTESKALTFSFLVVREEL